MWTTKAELTIFADTDDPLHVPLAVVYCWLLLVSWFYSISRWKNLISAIRSTNWFSDDPSRKAGRLPHEVPHVTIQIVTYNEGGVVEGTIDRACSVDWPLDKLTVQVLDDSTHAESHKIVAKRVEIYRSKGVQVEHKVRTDRVGYKAGNLAYHFDSIKGDFVLQLDADHRIQRDFLKCSMPYFFDKDGSSKDDIGFVQSPWAFYNVHQNLLTEVDSLVLDIHHAIEQTGRAARHNVFAFNGTGGIWRKKAIEAGGGWSWDTVTEDLALSYQAAMAGYKFRYVRDIPQVLEVPSKFLPHVQQKTRWTKGFFQVFRLTYWKIFVCPNIGWDIKFEAFCCITAPVQHATTLLALFLFPYLVLHGLEGPMFYFFSFFPLVDPTLAAIATCFAKESDEKGNYKSLSARLCRLGLVLPYFGLKCGASLFETKAILEGLFSNDATWLTTPKEGSNESKSRHVKRRTSVNTAKATWKDDVAAVIGLFIGFHRLVFLLSTKTMALNISVRFHILLNSFLVVSLFWVNGSFLLEKYLSIDGLMKQAKARKNCTFSLVIFFCVYSYAMSFAFLHREVKMRDFIQSQLESFPRPQERGVYFLANDKVMNLTVAFLNSFRYHNPTTPLALIPYDEYHAGEIRSLASKYDFEVFFDARLAKEIDKVSEAFHGEGTVKRHYRKLMIWSGPFDKFMFLDIDTVVLGNVDFAWPLLENTDVATGSSALYNDTLGYNDENIMRYRDTVWKRSIDDAGLLSPDQKSFAGQTGVILSSKRFASSQDLVDKTLTKAVRYKEHFESHYVDQPLLNYLFVTSGKRYSSLARMAFLDKRQGLKLEASSESVRSTPDRRLVWKDPDYNKFNAFCLHWAGNEAKKGSGMPHRELWEYWHDFQLNRK